MTSCDTFKIEQTQLSIPTGTNLPSSHNTVEPTISPSPLATETILLPTQDQLVPISFAPTIVVVENGLSWMECVIPNRDYYYGTTDIEVLTSCFDIPEWDEYNPELMAIRIPGVNGSDLKLSIGSDIYETNFDSSEGCCKYELLKNGEVILKTQAPLITFDPNRNFWNIEGKLVWELISEPPVIFVDGVNFNEKYQLDGSYYHYEIKGKLIYIAKKSGKYHIVYNKNIIGPEFEEISMAYCCGNRSVIYGHDQYWFLGKREGTQYVVLIQ
jgi:hypothetical protein